MKKKNVTAFVIIFLIIGIMGLLRFSGNVRTVDMVGLFGSGLACGVALMGMVSILRSKTKSE